MCPGRKTHGDSCKWILKESHNYSFMWNVRIIEILRFGEEAHIVRASFAWDGDLYGNPVVVMTDLTPARLFLHWRPTETFSRGIYWYRMIDGQLNGGNQATTTRADLVKWDLEVTFPGGPLQLSR